MKTIQKAILVAFLAVFAAPIFVFGGVNPSAVKAKIREVRLSENADGADAIVVFKDENADYKDMIANPVLGAGIVPNGTYRMLMFRMSDVLKPTPAENEGSACVAGEEFDQDVARSDGIALFKPDGSSLGLGEDTEQEVWVFVSTNGGTSGDTSNAFDPREGILLTNAITVNGDTTATIVINFDGLVETRTEGSVSTCDVDQPVFEVR